MRTVVKFSIKISVLLHPMFFNGISLQPSQKMKLSQGHRILSIDHIRREETRDYQYEVANPISFHESDPLRLDVKYEFPSSPPVINLNKCFALYRKICCVGGRY